MKYDAIIFDLFGTLVDNFGGGYLDALRSDGVLAELSGGQDEQFINIWCDDEAYHMRIVGMLGTPAEAIRHVCRAMGTAPSDSAVERAVAVRWKYFDGALTPRPDVPGTLAAIRDAGMKLALMSVASPEVPILWQAGPLAPLFDEAVFSCDVGFDKPDPRFYETVCLRLDTPPQRCLYVGDAGGSELSGAIAAGMEAALICAPHEQEIVMVREDASNWTGPRIEAISEVLELIGR